MDYDLLQLQEIYAPAAVPPVNATRNWCAARRRTAITTCWNRNWSVITSGQQRLWTELEKFPPRRIAPVQQYAAPIPG